MPQDGGGGGRVVEERRCQGEARTKGGCGVPEGGGGAMRLWKERRDSHGTVPVWEGVGWGPVMGKSRRGRELREINSCSLLFIRVLMLLPCPPALKPRFRL